MKIKAVCEKTGLTDRTIRYYIEEGLIFPSYKENYLGRKSFDFSDENISELNDIATLRNFDFSIEEIRGILLDPKSSPSIIKEAKERLSQNLLVNQKKVKVISTLEEECEYTLSDLARELSKPEEIEISKENIAPDLSKRVLSVLRGVGMFLAVWLPIIISLTIGLIKLNAYENPIFDPILIAVMLIGFVPSLISLFTSKIKIMQKQAVKKVILTICIICIPLCTVMSVLAITECEHRWQELAVDKEASCSQEGRIINKCEDCRGIDIIIVEKLPHVEVIDCAVKATCSGEGYTEGRHCSVCDEVIVPRKLIEKPAHRMERIVVNADCATEGYSKMECSECGYSFRTNTVAPTENHRFVKNGTLGFRCIECDMTVCEYGNADGSYSGVYRNVQYYITGIIDPNNEVERTLVIHGSGKMPDPEADIYPVHPWRKSQFTEEIRNVIICEGVTTIAKNAFCENHPDDMYMGNPFHSVKSFVIRNRFLKIDKNSPDISGIKCGITYEE